MDRTLISFLLVAIVLDVTSAQTAKPAPTPTPAPTPAPAPTLNYTCDTNLNVNLSTSVLKSERYSRIAIHGFNSKVTEGGNVLGVHAGCQLALANITSLPDPIQLQGCSLKQPIYVYIMKEKEAHIYGGFGFHEYTLTCDITNKTRQKVHAVATARVADITSPTTEIMVPIIVPSMNISSSTSTPIVVGTKLTLTISLEGLADGDKLYVLPSSCTAHPPNSREQIPLLSNGATQDAELMKNFDVLHKGSATTTVYAFRFTSSPSVTIECDIFICSQIHCESALVYTTPQTIGRKRRALVKGSENPSVKRTDRVKSGFTVLDNNSKTSSGQVKVAVSTIGTAGLLLMNFVLFRM